jgi:hypothetical protein
MSNWAKLSWGPYLLEWIRIENCIALLAGLTFGAPVNFASLRETQNTLLWVVFFFLIWIGLVVLVLIQMFAAIVLDAYLEVEAVSLAHKRGGEGDDTIFWQRLLLAPKAWFERTSVSKRNKKVKDSFSTYFTRPWRKLKKRFGFA